MKIQEKKIDIILPNRIGDSIMSLPSILCLKQLLESSEPDNYPKVTLFSSNNLTDIFQGLNIFEVKRMGLKSKIESWFKPADLAFFLYTSSQNMGFRSKISYGQVNPNKKFAGYSVNRPYLSFPPDFGGMPENLIQFLKNKYGLSSCSIRSFWFCLDLGYSAEQIIDGFNFSPDSLDLSLDIADWKPPFQDENYLVFCMEAAYGKTRDADRRWGEKYFFELAERAYKNYNLNSAFIGIDKSVPIPEKPYFIDLRSNLNMASLTQVLKYSKGYIGNDTGPLHLANFMKKKSIGIYFRESSTWDYSPIFPYLNRVVLNPVNPDDAFDALEELAISD